MYHHHHNLRKCYITKSGWYFICMWVQSELLGQKCSVTRYSRSFCSHNFTDSWFLKFLFKIIPDNSHTRPCKSYYYKNLNICKHFNECLHGDYYDCKPHLLSNLQAKANHVGLYISPLPFNKIAALLVSLFYRSFDTKKHILYEYNQVFYFHGQASDFLKNWILITALSWCRFGPGRTAH